jgi:sulfonate transport system permease protein
VRVFQTLIKLITNGKLGQGLLVSGLRVIKGFVVGAVIGIVLGVLMGLSKTLNKILSSLVSIFRPIPMIAWIPLLIMWLGIGEESKVAVIIIGALWPVLLNTISGILSVDKKLLEVAQVLEKGKKEILFNVILPSAWPSIITGIRLGISTAWTCVVAAEMIAASSGIGYMITYARELSQPDVVLVGVFTIGLVGLLIDFIIMRIQKRLLRWNYIQQGK